MSDQFYCSRPGGIQQDGRLIVMEGTREKGPWYNAWEFSDFQLDLWASRGWIHFLDKEVR